MGDGRGDMGLRGRCFDDGGPASMTTDDVDRLLAKIEQEGDAEQYRLARILSAAAWTPEPKQEEDRDAETGDA
jgi:hypothetical protein